MIRLTGLDLLRAIAAMLVALAHLEIIFFDSLQLSKAYLAVDLFFMLSGYVMARTYESRLGTALSWHHFMRIRAKRLWATLAVGTLLGLVYLLDSHSLTMLAPALLLALAFLPVRGLGAHTFPFNPPAWSIFFELLANLAHALVLARLCNRQLLIIVAASVPILAYAFMPWGQFVAAESSRQFVANVFRVLVPYIVGILLYRKLQDQPRIHFMVPVIGTVAASIIGLFLPNLAFDIVFDIIVAPLLIIASLRLVFGRFSGAVTVAGAMSYPLYAVHYPIMLLVHGNGGNALMAMVLSLALAAAIAAWYARASRSFVAVR